MSFNFQPQEKYLAWVPEGKAIFSQYGLCGQELASDKSQRLTLDERIAKLKQFYPLSKEDEDRIISLYEVEGFSLSGVCCMPKGHRGKCKNNPWKKRKVQAETPAAKIQSGFVQKITAGSTNDGGDYGAMNRSGNRWWPIQANREIIKNVKKKIVESKSSSKQNIFVRQNLASGPYMAVLANFDMLSQCAQVEGFYNYFEIDQQMQKILKQRFDDLVSYYAERSIKIAKDGKPKCPLTHTIFEPWMFGKGSDDDNGVQFGHVEPKVHDEYMSKPYNVCLITREGNSWQGNRSISATFDRMRQALEEQDK